MAGPLAPPRNRSNIKLTVPKSSRNKRRTYCFTLNNYTEKDGAHLAQTFIKMNANKFAFQEEIGKKCKTPHLQGCVFFKNAIAFNTMKSINKRISWFRLDYPKRAIRYCLKDETRKPGGEQWTFGINIKDYLPKPKTILDGMKREEFKAWCYNDMRKQLKDMKIDLPKNFFLNL